MLFLCEIRFFTRLKFKFYFIFKVSRYREIVKDERVF